MIVFNHCLLKKQFQEILWSFIESFRLSTYVANDLELTNSCIVYHYQSCTVILRKLPKQRICTEVPKLVARIQTISSP